MDTTRPEPEAQQTAEGGHTLKSPPRKTEENISPERQPDEEEQPVSSPDNSPTEGPGDSTISLEDQAEAGKASPITLEPAKVYFPRLSSPTSPTDGHFGVVSTGGQLVCEFKGDGVSMSPPPEEKIVDSLWDSEPKTLGGSVLLPPQASNWIEVVRPSNPLGDQSDTVDCPFCMKRVETTVKKKASQL